MESRPSPPVTAALGFTGGQHGDWHADLVIRPGTAHGPLRPIEAATAAVLAGVAVAVVMLGALLPRAGALELLAAVPLAIVAHRHRARATIAAAIAGSAIGFLTSGLDAGLAMLACAVMGGVVGTIRRRGHGVGTLVCLALVLGPLSALVADGLLVVFSALRDLFLATVRAVVSGFTRVMRVWPPAHGAADWLDHVVTSAIATWWLWVFVAVAVAVPVMMLVVWSLLSAVLARLDWVVVHDVLDSGDAGAAEGEPAATQRPSAPLPLELKDVWFRYPRADTDALRGVDLRLDVGQFVVVVGDNGSGKSTLAGVLAGAPVDAGTVWRDGAVGLGRPGGTALVSQRPETQVLGTTVAEDVVWGLPAGHDTDVDAALAEVGLAGMADRSTAGLSGGQSQRLAIASALARGPALLISDESTAMIDAAGRDSVLALLAELPRRHAMTVLHVTHSDVEAARADRVVRIAEGRIVADRPGPGDPPPDTTAPAPSRPPVVPGGEPVLRARGIEHWYGYGTPWAHRALTRVDLDLRAGEALLVTGRNGSGKSTLAWVLAGLTRPTHGECLVDGRPVHERVGSVAVAFQHPRLQLQRPTVAEDVLAAAGRRGARPGDPECRALVDGALRLVGLSPELAGSRIDALSGGQTRQVALAGLLAGRPRVLILDEPLAGLDPDTRRALLAALVTVRDGGLALIVISHDLDGLGTACTRTARLDEGVLA